MTWYDLGELVLIILGGLALLALAVIAVFFLGFILHEMWPWRKPPPPPVYADTPFGRFRKVLEDWQLDEEGSVAIYVKDRHAAPDPEFVTRLPGLRDDLPRLETLAREFEEFEAHDNDFLLSALSQGEGGEDFVLLFGVKEDEQGDLGTLFVAFADGQPFSATLVD